MTAPLTVPLPTALAAALQPGGALLAGLNGLSTAAALIVAIGAQNAFVLRQGLRREHVGLVVALCALSDLLLMQSSVWGLGAALAGQPALVTTARLGGALFLLIYGARALRRALHPGALVAEAGPAAAAGRASPRRTALTVLALTWLNPHVYLDMLLLGAIAARLPTAERGAFGVGACLASVVWFVLLGYGAARLAPVFARPAAWRVLDALVGGTMWVLALGLLWP